MKKGLMWIGAGVWVLILAVIIGVVTIPEDEEAKRERALSKPHEDPGIRAGVEALEIYYDGVYRHANCWTRGTSEQPYVFARCGSAGSDITGGLYVVRAVENGAEIYAVNGKAFQHIKDVAMVSGSDGATFPVSRWAGDPIDIPAVLKLF